MPLVKRGAFSAVSSNISVVTGGSLREVYSKSSRKLCGAVHGEPLRVCGTDGHDGGVSRRWELAQPEDIRLDLVYVGHGRNMKQNIRQSASI